MSFHFVRELPTPAVVKEMHPVPTELAEIKKERDRMISDIILGKDDRFLVIRSEERRVGKECRL